MQAKGVSAFVKPFAQLRPFPDQSFMRNLNPRFPCVSSWTDARTQNDQPLMVKGL